ncbi:MAG: hypothetical protein ABL962_05790 [Fimbriimonadaceae bacterium]
MNKAAESLQRCVFCDAELGKANRSREHVIPEWLQEHLGITDLTMQLKRYRPSTGEVLAIRNKHPMSRFVNGLVCRRCNNGWMASLEGFVKPILTELIDGQRSPSSVTFEEGTQLARWLLKTACTSESGSNYRKVIPAEHYKAALDWQQQLPQGALAFLGQANLPSPYIELSGCAWCCCPDLGDAIDKYIHLSYKYGFQLGNVMMVLAYWSPGTGLVTTFFTGTHCPIGYLGVGGLSVYETGSDSALRESVHIFSKAIGLGSDTCTTSKHFTDYETRFTRGRHDGSEEVRQ